MTPPDVRVPPLDPGALCTLSGAVVRVYAAIWPGELGPIRYRCYRFGERTLHAVATREQLQVIGGGS